MNVTIQHSRLALARRLRSLTGKALAEQVGVTGARISQLERNGGATSAELLGRLSMALRVPPTFLTDAEAVEDVPTRYHYRHQARTPARIRHVVESQQVLFSELLAELKPLFARWPEPTIPRIPRRLSMSHEEGLLFAERAASHVRREWGLGDGPIDDLVSLLESRGGIWVRSLGHATEMIDAFSLWDADGQAHVVMSHAKGDGFRSRMDAAHELAHLCMHEDLDTGARDLETEAFRFGAAFLVPASQWRICAPTENPTSWRSYVEHSKTWGVAISALIRRSHDLGLLDEQQYRSAMIQYSSAGLRRDESPARGIAPIEHPQLLRGMLEALQMSGVSVDDLAARMSLPSDLIRAVIGSESMPPDRSSNVVSLGAWRSANSESGAPGHDDPVSSA